MGAFAKAPTYVETCKPLIPPASAVPRHPPLARGALGGDFLLFQELYQLDNHRGGKG